MARRWKDGWTRADVARVLVISSVIPVVINREPAGHSFWESILWCAMVGLGLGLIVAALTLTYRRVRSGSWKGVQSGPVDGRQDFSGEV